MTSLHACLAGPLAVVGDAAEVAAAGGFPRLLFVTVALSGLAFFLFAKRRFDWYSVAYFSGMAYFLPGFFGFVRMPRTVTRDTLLPVPIVDDVYYLMTAALLALLAAAIAFDLAGLDHRRLGFRIQGSSWVGPVALLLAALGIAMTIATVGGAIFSASKSDLLLVLGRWRHLYVNAALVGIAVSWIERKVLLGIVFAGVLGFDLYLGFRFPLAIATIALFCLWLSERGRGRFALRSWRVLAMGTAAAGFFFFAKRLVAPIRGGNLRLVVRKLTDPEQYWAAIVESEPFKTFAILNETMIRGIRVGLDHLLHLQASLVFMSPELGLEVESFSQEVVHQQLFPDAKSGVASNIWAEMWSTGGWTMIAASLLLWVMALGGLSLLLRTPDPTVRAVTALLGAYWAFYLHRNDLIYQITLSRRVVTVAVLCLAAAVLAAALARRSSPGPDEERDPARAPDTLEYGS